MSRLGTWRFTKFQTIYPKMPQARGFSGFGLPEQKHHKKVEEFASRVRMGLGVVRKAIAKGNCKRATRALETMNKNLGRAHAHLSSTELYKNRLIEVMKSADNKVEQASKVVSFYCVLDAPILTEKERLAGFRTRKRRRR